MARAQSIKKVVLQGRGPLTLRPSDYKATGGEGSVYQASRTIIKLYTDPQKMLRDSMAEKISLLSAIKHRFIVVPQNLVVDPQSGNPIGFYMEYVDGEPLPRIFTNDFRQRERFGNDEAKTLVARMRETVQFAHDEGAVLVDANELNWLVILAASKGPEPRVIDVDSWMIGRWPATVIMPSIRDWHAKEFSMRTDWFSWGIITFQVFTGIHPYKGVLDGFKPSDLVDRMIANKSVFTPGVRLNHAVRDFSCIPGPLLDWYKAVFQTGERALPPSPFDTGVSTASPARVLRAVTTATGALVFEKLLGKSGNETYRIWPSGVVLLSSGDLVDIASKRFIGRMQSRDGEVVRCSGGWLVADREGSLFQFRFVSETNLQSVVLQNNMAFTQFVRYEDRLFVVTERGLTEMVFRLVGTKPVLSAGQTWGVMVKATRWFEGVGVQDAIGAMFIVVPFGDKACASVRVRELDDLHPVSAKAGNRFVTLICVDKTGAYRKLELTFDREYSAYTIWQGGTDSPDLNIAILPRGVCATVVNDGELDIFVPVNGQINRIADNGIKTDMLLAWWGDRVVYIQNGEVWGLRMK